MALTAIHPGEHMPEELEALDFPLIDFPEPRCQQFPVSVSPRLRTTLDLRDFRGAEPSTSYRRLTQNRIDNWFL
jgi:hypothetical protein